MKMFIFLTARATKRVLRVLEKRETSAAKARARDACANRETGLYNKPIWRPIIEVSSRVN